MSTILLSVLATVVAIYPEGQAVQPQVKGHPTILLRWGVSAVAGAKVGDTLPLQRATPRSPWACNGRAVADGPEAPDAPPPDDQPPPDAVVPAKSGDADPGDEHTPDGL